MIIIYAPQKQAVILFQTKKEPPEWQLLFHYWRDP